MKKLEKNQDIFNLCLRQLNAFKAAGVKTTSNSQDINCSTFLLIKEDTTNYLLSYFINGDEIRDRIKEIESTKLSCEEEEPWINTATFITLHYLFPPSAIYIAIKGYNKQKNDVQTVQTIIGQIDSLLFILKDKGYKNLS
ncbi:MAG: hypothetical protein HRT73_08230 [Flavobacteriales bacterium]|nr:hypothetical protein [Flavobacteriales bacterium]